MKTHPEAARRWEVRLRSLYKRTLTPPPRLGIAEHADRTRILSPASSPEPGPWRTSRVPWLYGIFEVLADPKVSDIVWMSSSQVAKTEGVLCLIGYYTHHDPSPIMVLLPNEKPAAYAFSKDRVAPMFKDSPKLRGLLTDGDTILHKNFPGGKIVMAGANAPAGLASHPIRILLADEIDRFPLSAGSEGDPLSLGEQRTTNFWNAKRFKVSTPTRAGESRIETEHGLSDQRVFEVPCPDCSHRQELVWDNLRWDKEGKGENQKHLTHSAHYVCEACGSCIPESSKPAMLKQGAWRITNPDGLFPGFHINSLYSPWVSWSDLADEWLKKYKDPIKRQTFVNLKLGLPFDESDEELKPDDLTHRLEDYGTDPLPDGVCLITAGVDIQIDRAEIEIVGWGPGEESWSLEYFRVPGDPTGKALWKAVDEILGKTYSHPTGAQLHIVSTAVDSGDWATSVYGYTRGKEGRRIWAVKGLHGEYTPVWAPSKTRRKRTTLYMVGVDTAKGILRSRLQVESHGPGYCHFPERSPYGPEYFKQLTSEYPTLHRNRYGRTTKQWKRKKGHKAEALDCRVYAMAAMYGVLEWSPSLEAMHQNLTEPPEPEPEPARQRRRGSGYVGRWK